MAQKKILIVAPHPDDETLGVGGTLLKHKQKGDLISWLITTTVNLHPNYPDDFIQSRKKQIQAVSALYAMDHTAELSFLSKKLDEHPLGSIISAINAVIEDLKPNTIYLPFLNDAHSDHRITFTAALACTKTFRHPSIKEILMYETPSETDFSIPTGSSFHPNVFVDISDTFEKKITILQQYETELGKHPFPRSLEIIEALGKLRGVQCGARFAEAFMLVKRID